MNATSKKWAAGIIGLAALIFAVFYYQGGKSQSERTDVIDPAFNEYISAYTVGTISSGSPITIVLSRDIIEFAAVGEEVSAKLFSFSPSVNGTAIMQDRRTVSFRPSTRLKSGQLYEVSFYLGKVVTVPKELAIFKYDVQVIPQNFELTVDNIRPYVNTELKRQKIEATLTTADFAESADVEKMVLAQQDDKPLKLTWAHTADGKQHALVVEDVARKESQSVVKLSTSGASLGIDLADDQNVEIPGLGDFKVTSVRVEQAGSQHVEVQFSDPLNEKQNLDGLISIADVGSLDYTIKENRVLIYPPVKQTGTKTLTVEFGVRNILDYKLKETFSIDVLFEPIKPAVRFTGKGSVLPGTDGLIMPFEAVNLKAVDVQVIRIYEDNVMQFLQVNNWDGNQELRRVGKPILHQAIQLDNSGITDFGKWNRFTLDLASLINSEPGAIYQVRLSFKRRYLAYPCDNASDATEDADVIEPEPWSAPTDGENSYWDSYDDYSYDEDYEWSERDNPCNKSYYSNQRAVRRNVIASDIGMVAKRGSDGKTVIFTNDLRTTNPLSGVQVDLFDYQQQLVGTASTGSDGKAIITSKETPFVLVARNGSQRGYLKLQDGESLSLSNFDVSGAKVAKGIKGFIYGERGVWRPGDSLYLSFLLEDKLKLIPPAHPVVFELSNPQGQVTSRLVRSASEHGFYSFGCVTAPDAPTGYWNARVKLGGAEFNKEIRIEMIKPNRLKINLDFGVDKLTVADQDVTGTLKVNWLQGTPGKNLKAEFDVLLTKGVTQFAKYPDFAFDDPTSEFAGQDQRIFEGTTDSEGMAKVTADIKLDGEAPGVLNAVFRGKVFEESGNFSIDRFSLPYYPYASFIGIRLPAGDKARGMLLTDTTHRVDVVTVDVNGNPVSHSGIQLSLHKINWKWWWDSSDGTGVEFMQGKYQQPIAKGTIQTSNGKGSWTFRIKQPEWGRFLVKAYDPVSRHTTGKIVYIDWPGWAGRAQEGADGATMLSFTSDKSRYNTGEKINLTIPGSDHGRALISIENGSQVIKTFWKDTNAGDNTFVFDATPEMTPNMFVHVTLLQPHSQAVNDLPIRMYGVIPIVVEDPQTHLTPVITMPDVLEPGQEVKIKISESTNRTMTYTLAVVEEGLLDLTKFKTPDAWNHFYSREGLGVKTWDIYNEVMGAFGGRIERLLAIGGDDDIGGKDDDSKNNRFKPVVKFFGPFNLTGGTNEHTFTMPNYVGSVKTMVVAGYEGAYGLADKATPVTKPLMVLATLPRVLGPEEQLKLPVTIFKMDPAIKNIRIEVKVSGPLALIGQATQTISMTESDMTVNFDLSVKSETGIGKVEVIASSGKFSAIDRIDIAVRNPNPSVINVLQTGLEPGQSWSGSIAPIGIPGSNTATLEVSSLPPINLGQRMNYIMQYPYGCIEQTTSSVFPQLYLDRVLDLNPTQKSTIQVNINAGIQRLKSFQTADGGFAYWPGGDDSESWGSTYAGHFLVEAEAKGYFIPNEMLKRWKKYQRNKAQGWRKNQESQSGELIQAYRLYSLAIAGDPDLGAMNRLREFPALPATAAWMLASAYARAGQPEAATALIASLPTSVKPYQEMAYSYGSDLRDKAIILETLIALGDRKKGFDLVKDISAALSNSNYWMSTQTTSWCLKSVGAFAGTDQRGELKFTYSYQGKEVTAATGLPIAQIPLEVSNSPSPLKLVSASKGQLFVRIISQGIPARGSETDADENLNLSVTYTLPDGSSVDPSRIEQGQGFIIAVTVTNPGIRGNYKNMALNHILPSGWEINNLRLDNAEDALKSDVPTYQDIRDDRVYTYFDLPANQRKTFRYMVTASFAGSYYLPGVTAEAMYDRTIFARRKGQVVEVVRSGSNP